MTPLRLPLAAIAALLAITPASAQGHDPDLISREELPDARTVDVTATADGGYRVDLFNATAQPTMLDTAVTTQLADIDGDGLPDLIVILKTPTPDGLVGAHVWDLFLPDPHMMHTSSGVTSADTAVEELRREITGRFTLANGLAAVNYLGAAAARPDPNAKCPDPAAPNHLAIIEGVLIYAEIARTRKALDAASAAYERGEIDADALTTAANELNGAFLRREVFALMGRSQVYD